MHKLFSQSSNIGIIGGADGPTAIFVSSVDPWVYAVSALTFVALVILTIFIIKKIRKK